MSRGITYVPSVTGAKFLADNRSIVKGLMGPVGSGKSITCIMDCLKKVTEQFPNAEGVRKSRVAVIRNTYGELKTTTIKSFNDWIPPENSRITSEAPFTGVIHGKLSDGTSYESEFLFLALDKPDDAHRLLSLEVTFAWINEAREIPEKVFRDVLQRTGRYPKKTEAPTTWAGVLMDTNPPDTDHWYYRLAELEKPKGFSFYRQPGGVILRNGVYEPNPDAENIDHLPLGYDYYLRQITPGADPNMIKVMLMGEYGTLRSDRPVFPNFSDKMHVRENLALLRDRGLLLTFDFGLTPACLFCQIREDGQLRVLEEMFNDNSGLKQFLDNEVIPKLMEEKYRHLPVTAVCDPAGTQRAQVDDTLTPVNELIRHGIAVRPAPTNDFNQRKEAVEQLLGRLCTGGEPALIVDAQCQRLIKGFISGYYFKRKSGYNDLFKDVPEKNLYSHVHDALQYAALEASIGEIRRFEERRYSYSADLYDDTPADADACWRQFL